MRHLIVNAAVAVFVATANAGPSPDNFRLEGQPFRPRVPVVWAAPMTNVPPTATVYRVLAQQFSMLAISNVFAMSGFTWKTMTESKDKKFMSWRHYENDRERLVRSLDIAPAYGYIEYHDYSAIGVSTNGDQNAPSREQVEKLAIEYLQQLGGDTNQLWLRPHSATERRAIMKDKTSKRYVTNFVMRGAMYARQLDGVRFLGAGGRGGFAVDFGAQAKISSLQLDWRNVKPYRLYKTLTSDEILAEVKNGKTVISIENPDVPEHPEKLAITKVTPYFMSAESGSPEDFIYPFANVEITVNSGQTNNSTFYVNCRILSTNVLSGE